MDILIGFAVGYYVGSQAGHDAIQELKTAVTDISASEEFQALQTSAMSMAGDLARDAVSPKKNPRDELALALCGQAAGALQRRLAAA